ncbi:MAG TPA: galactosyltransferase-related protein [Steroidobacteraceae bacterium]|jgi:hypothetical protein
MPESISTSIRIGEVQRWLNRWWPSARLRTDPLQGVHVDNRYVPVSIANLKLTPVMREQILARRVARPLTFERQRLTILIPYRDRQEHLRQLLPQLTATLRKQEIDYRVLVIEQEAGGLFNRGKLVNVGIQHAAQASDYYCIHDVDAVPVVANYLCPSQPLRLMHKVRRGAGEEERPTHYFSAAVSIRKEQVVAANGFSNEYWGWGKEDDDFFFRLLLADCVCYYDTLGTFHDLPNPAAQQVQRSGFSLPPHVATNRKRRSLLLRGLLDPVTDGLNTLHYEIIDRMQGEGYEKIRVRW